MLYSAHRWRQCLNADSSLTPISRYLETDCHLCATLENLTRSFILSRTDLSGLARSEFQPNPWFTGVYDVPESNMGDWLALHGARLLRLKVNGCKKTLKNSWCWSNEEDGSTHHVRNYLLSQHVSELVCACDNVIHIRQFINFSVIVSFMLGVGISQAVSHCSLGWCVCVLWRKKHFHHSIP